jgi:hypothetical protein
MALDSIPSIIQSAFVYMLPPKIDYGIAFIGCGGFMNYGHSGGKSAYRSMSEARSMSSSEITA